MNISSTERRFFRPLVGNWDLIIAAVVAGAFLWVVLSSERPLDDVKAVLIASVPFGLLIATGAIVAGRWVSDRMKDAPYGQVLRRIDPTEMQVQRPTYIVASAGFLTTIVGIVLLIIYEEFNRTLTVILYAGLLFFATYGVFGFADLIRLGRRHLSRMSEVQYLREEEARQRRRGRK